MSFEQVSISIENLTKSFFVYDKPSDRLKQFILPKVYSWFGLKKKYYSEFYANRDISFDVKLGETIAIIGRNGSGKSTLLQMICGTLSPTQGIIKTNGKVAALLELGSGFNPEFTGRENIYLNASIYGLSNKEIDEKLSSILDFADIGEFIDQPVKTYSSGMYVRLAFAVIAHVDAEILVIDEALAVGDAVFTQKCMRFIRQFQKHGTLLFVSHDMSSVQNLCQKAIWLHKGKIVDFGDSKSIAEKYLKYTLQETYGDEISLHDTDELHKNYDNQSNEDIEQDTLLDYGANFEFKNNLLEAKGWRTGKVNFTDCEVKNLTHNREVFKGGELVKLSLKLCSEVDLESPIVGFIVKDKLGQDLFGENTYSLKTNMKPVKAGDRFTVEFEFRLPMLLNGDYAVMCSVAEGDLYENIQHQYLHDAIFIRVQNSLVRWGIVGIPFNRVEFKNE